MSIGEMPIDDELEVNERLEQSAAPFAALYEHWERHQWSSLALDFSEDAANFKRLDEADQNGLVWLFANRFHAEFNVARLLGPFLVAAPTYEMQLLLATQVADEHRHLQTVLRIYEEVFGVRGGLDAIRARADLDLDPVSQALLYEKLEEWVTPLNERRDEDTFAQAIFVYHVLGEGVIARTGQNLAAAQYERYGGFPGLIEGQRLVSRDEARHIGIGVSYLRQRMERDPVRTRELIGEVVSEFLPVANALLDTANAGMTDLVVSGYGVDPTGFYREAMRLVGIRLRSLGFIEA